jgi:K+-transporting ATPase KdpF subunit
MAIAQLVTWALCASVNSGRYGRCCHSHRDRGIRAAAVDGRGDRPHMSLQLPLGAFIAHMSGADFFGLVVSVLVIAYLFYALIRGEKL